MTLPDEWFRWNELSKIEQDHIVRLVNHIASCPEEYNHILLTNIENLKRSTMEQMGEQINGYFNQEVPDEMLPDWMKEEGGVGLTE